MGKTEEFRHQLETQDDVAAISPGVFKESRHEERVFFVEKLAANLSTVANIFVHSAEDGEIGTTVAKRVTRKLRQTAIVSWCSSRAGAISARQVRPNTGSSNSKNTPCASRPDEAKEYRPSIKSRPTAELLKEKSAEARAELIWRTGLPLSALVLCLLAIPMSFVNPRAGRSLNLMLASLLYMLYNNMLSITQAWVAQEKVSPLLGMWAVHLVMLALIAALFYLRLSVSPLRRLRRPRR